MSRSLIRLAVLSTGLLLVPASSQIVRGADEPAPPPRPTEGRPDVRPEGRPTERPEGRPGERPEGRPAGRMDPAAMFQRLETVLADLDLSAEQKTKIDEAIAKAKKSAAERRDGEPRDASPMMAAMGELRTTIEATLNDEQRKAFAEKMPMRQRPGEGRPGEGRPGEGRPGEGRPPAGEGGGRVVLNALNAAMEKTELTADQKAKLRENFAAELQKAYREGGQRPGPRPDGAPREGGPRDGAPREGGPRDGAPREGGDRPARERPSL